MLTERSAIREALLAIDSANVPEVIPWALAIPIVYLALWELDYVLDPAGWASPRRRTRNETERLPARPTGQPLVEQLREVGHDGVLQLRDGLSTMALELYRTLESKMEGAVTSEKRYLRRLTSAVHVARHPDLPVRQETRVTVRRAYEYTRRYGLDLAASGRGIGTFPVNLSRVKLRSAIVQLAVRNMAYNVDHHSQRSLFPNDQYLTMWLYIWWSPATVWTE